MRNDFYKEMSEVRIELDRRILRSHYGLFILNAIVFLFCCVTTLNNPHANWFSGVGIGATFSGGFWLWLNIWEARLNIKIEKEKLAYREKRDEFDKLKMFV